MCILISDVVWLMARPLHGLLWYFFTAHALSTHATRALVAWVSTSRSVCSLKMSSSAVFALSFAARYRSIGRIC